MKTLLNIIKKIFFIKKKLHMVTERSWQEDLKFKEVKKQGN
jgi:hypothetical protein